MIYDNLKNIELYAHLSTEILKGLQFLKEVKSDIELGTFYLSPKIKVMVTEYSTKCTNELGYESHKKYIDIQYPIIGEELILCNPIDKLKLREDYNEAKDIIFYELGAEQHTDIIIGNGYFTILFPDDGHAPQHCVQDPNLIKKITLKIEM